MLAIEILYQEQKEKLPKAVRSHDAPSGKSMHYSSLISVSKEKIS